MLTVHAVFQSDLHNLPKAFEAFLEALDLCDLLGDPRHTFAVLHNLGVALLYAEFPRLAMSVARASLEHARKIESGARRAAFEGSALSNIANGCLFTEEYGLGLRCSKEANELYELAHLAPEDSEAERFGNHTFLLTVQARLLQRVGLLHDAKVCLERATEFAAKVPTHSRTTQAVEIACALNDVYSGQFDEGVARLHKTALNSWSPELVADALRDLIEAHTFAKRRDGAADYMHQLGIHMQRVRSDHILFHHKRHIDRLKVGDSLKKTSAVETLQKKSPFRPAERRRDYLGERVRVLEDLCVAAELHDDPSGKHPYRVAELARILAEGIGMDSNEAARIAAAAVLHDVGKVAVPASILRKPGPLVGEEEQIMRTHATAGAELLASVEIDNQDTAVVVARHHHEWWSGGGYPDGLVGTAIPLAARVVSIAEAFDAMTHDRAYRPGLSVARAVELIEERAGHQFDPHLAQVFCELIRDLHVHHTDFDTYVERDLKESSFLKTKRRLIDRFSRSAA